MSGWQILGVLMLALPLVGAVVHEARAGRLAVFLGYLASVVSAVAFVSVALALIVGQLP